MTGERSRAKINRRKKKNLATRNVVGRISIVRKKTFIECTSNVSKKSWLEPSIKWRWFEKLKRIECCSGKHHWSKRFWSTNDIHRIYIDHADNIDSLLEYKMELQNNIHLIYISQKKNQSISIPNIKVIFTLISLLLFLTNTYSFPFSNIIFRPNRPNLKTQSFNKQKKRDELAWRLNAALIKRCFKALIERFALNWNWQASLWGCSALTLHKRSDKLLPSVIWSWWTLKNLI